MIVAAFDFITQSSSSLAHLVIGKFSHSSLNFIDQICQIVKASHGISKDSSFIALPVLKDQLKQGRLVLSVFLKTFQHTSREFLETGRELGF